MQNMSGSRHVPTLLTASWRGSDFIIFQVIMGFRVGEKKKIPKQPFDAWVISPCAVLCLPVSQRAEATDSGAFQNAANLKCKNVLPTVWSVAPLDHILRGGVVEFFLPNKRPSGQNRLFVFYS